MTTELLDPVFPHAWVSRPLRTMFHRVKDTGHPEEQMLSVYRDYGVVPKYGRTDNFNKTAENRDIYQLVDRGWLVVNRMKAWQGSLGVSSHRGIVSGHYVCFSPSHSEDPLYLNYLLRSAPYTAALRRASRGVRPSQMEIDNDLLSSLRVLLPPIEEQRRIAAYLDAEVARIDELIEAKRESVRLLNERVDALVGIHVTKSPLVPGGENGAAAPIGRWMAKVRRPGDSDAQTITAFRDGQVTSRQSRRVDGYTDAWTDNPSQQGVEAGDIVIHGLDGFAGAIGVAEVAGACSPVYHVCRPTDGDADFLARLLRLLAVTGYLSLFATSTRERAVDFRNWDRFRHIPIPDVPAELQRELGDMIRSIRPLRSAADESVELLQERRRSLIAAVVTGKMEVP